MSEKGIQSLDTHKDGKGGVINCLNLDGKLAQHLIENPFALGKVVALLGIRVRNPNQLKDGADLVCLG